MNKRALICEIGLHDWDSTETSPVHVLEGALILNCIEKNKKSTYLEGQKAKEKCSGQQDVTVTVWIARF